MGLADSTSAAEVDASASYIAAGVKVTELLHDVRIECIAGTSAKLAVLRFDPVDSSICGLCSNCYCASSQPMDEFQGAHVVPQHT